MSPVLGKITKIALRALNKYARTPFGDDPKEEDDDLDSEEETSDSESSDSDSEDQSSDSKEQDFEDSNEDHEEDSEDDSYPEDSIESDYGLFRKDDEKPSHQRLPGAKEGVRWRDRKERVSRLSAMKLIMTKLDDMRIKIIDCNEASGPST